MPRRTPILLTLFLGMDGTALNHNQPSRAPSVGVMRCSLSRATIYGRCPAMGNGLRTANLRRSSILGQVRVDGRRRGGGGGEG